MTERSEDASIVRHEEELEVARELEQTGAVRARKRVETRDVEEEAERAVEDADIERIAVSEADSGEIETLPDGSVSVPLFEEQLVVTKRLVVRERIIIRKRTTTEVERIGATLRTEQIEIEEDPG